MPKVPEGFHTLTPQIAVSNGDKAIALYKEALGAKEMRRMLLPGTDKIMDAALEIGSSKMFLSDRAVQKKVPKGLGSAFYVYVADVDAAHKRALAAGMAERMPPMDMFWGDRMSAVDDRFGHRWCFATHTREVGEADMRKAMQQQFEAAKSAPKRAGKKAAKKNAKEKKR
jgi:PhnB protein